MDEDGEYTHQPVVGEVAEQNEKTGETVVEQVLVEISVWPDEGMHHQLIEVLAEGHQQIDLHPEGVFSEGWEIDVAVHT